MGGRSWCCCHLKRWNGFTQVLHLTQRRCASALCSVTARPPSASCRFLTKAAQVRRIPKPSLSQKAIDATAMATTLSGQRCCSTASSPVSNHHGIQLRAAPERSNNKTARAESQYAQKVKKTFTTILLKLPQIKLDQCTAAFAAQASCIDYLSTARGAAAQHLHRSVTIDGPRH